MNRHAFGRSARRQVVLAAVRSDGWALEFAAPDLQDDEEVALAAVQQEGQALQMASAALRADPTVVRAAVSADWEALDHAASELQGDADVPAAGRGSGGSHCRRGMDRVPICHSVDQKARISKLYLCVHARLFSNHF